MSFFDPIALQSFQQFHSHSRDSFPNNRHILRSTVLCEACAIDFSK